jgi:folate-binding protein YgfZ
VSSDEEAVTTLDAAATWSAMREGVVAFEGHREVVSVSGRDAVSWLQGQLSQDMDAIAPGAGAEAFLLSPQGKVVALVRVTRAGEEDVVLDFDEGFSEAVLERLKRYRLRVKAEVNLVPWRSVLLRGPKAGEALASRASAGQDGALVVPFSWPGLGGVDLLGAGVTVPAGVPLGDAEALDAARMAAGIPLMGRELTERTIPHESGVVARAVSLTKGCYTGQELVARLDARGARVPRVLRLFVADEAEAGGAGAVAGSDLVVDGRVVGQATSVAVSPATGGVVAMAYVRREVEPPAPGELAGAAGRIEALPVLSLTPAGPAASVQPESVQG